MHWITTEAEKKRVSLAREDADYLSSFGGDLWKVSNELEKMSLVRERRSGGERQTSTVFSLGDTFFSSPRDALRHLATLLRAGEDAVGLFAYLANHTRTLFTVRAFSDKQMSIPREFGVHPFVAKKAASGARALSLPRLSRMLALFWEEDRRIKTGESSAEDSLIRLIAKK